MVDINAHTPVPIRSADRVAAPQGVKSRWYVQERRLTLRTPVNCSRSEGDLVSGRVLNVSGNQTISVLRH